ncbi:MAG: hypothetical protein JO072_00815 [Parafilimonas sp.]|nr:hypothetical protein [Parafilimonas sp.]
MAVSASAFTAPPKANSIDPVYDWMIYDANGVATGTFLEDKTEAQVRAATPQCNSTVKNCFQNYTQDHHTPLGLFIQKP